MGIKTGGRLNEDAYKIGHQDLQLPKSKLRRVLRYPDVMTFELGVYCGL